MRVRLLFLLITLFISTLLFARQQAQEPIPTYIEKNKDCLKCHAQKFYTYYNEWTERDVKDRMNPYFIIDSAQFYISNHRNFQCTDCHSSEYETFPHSGELRMEIGLVCMDCHGGDPNFEDYHFERIEEEFVASVHSTKHDQDFTCWMCHNPHSYHISARRDHIPDVVAYDNEICLSCHANINKFQLLTDKENPNILTTHEWLPNQKLHFMSVRCIECHAVQQEDILAAHNVRPKEEAVKLCKECHSQSSLLFTSLYKYQLKETRRQKGFLSASAVEWEQATGTMGAASDQDTGDGSGGESSANIVPPFIIGSGSNPVMNLVSLVLFFTGILAVAIHAILRIIYKTS